MRINYRRETKQLMGLIKTPMNQFCLEFGISPATYRNWVKGLAGPQTEEKFNRLKQLAQGIPALRQTRFPQHDPPPGEDVLLMRGQIKQLTDQIAHLQGEVAILRNDHDKRMVESEKKIRELTEAVATALERLPGHSSGQKKTG